jgi:uncharacterized DUF497 family protein
VKVAGFIWLESIVEKLAIKHQVEPYEVEEMFAGKPHFRFMDKGSRANEDVYAALGRTDAGRYLITFFILKLDGSALILSSRDMVTNEKKRYARR